MIDFALGFLIGAGAGWAAAKWRGRRGPIPSWDNSGRGSLTTKAERARMGEGQ